MLHRPLSTHPTAKVRPADDHSETRAQIRRYFYAEHWKIGTIARELVRNAIESERFRGGAQTLRSSVVDPYIGFVRQTLEQYLDLRATRIYAVVQDRGYAGSVVQLPRAVARLRPQNTSHSCNSTGFQVSKGKSIGLTSAL